MRNPALAIYEALILSGVEPTLIDVDTTIQMMHLWDALAYTPIKLKQEKEGGD